jgi:hypothetical protein
MNKLRSFKLAGVLLSGAAGLSCFPAAAGACSPWAERVHVWDVAADLAVIAIWNERERPPEASPRSPAPDQYLLRRISTGRGLADHLCAAEAPNQTEATKAPTKCDWGAAFKDSLPSTIQWREPGRVLSTGRIRVRNRRSPTGDSEYSLEALSRRGWQRVLWLDFVASGYTERRHYRIGPSVQLADRLAFAVEYHSRGGNCAHTAVQVLSLGVRDLEAPQNRERHARMVANPREDRLLAHWRTAAEMGPLPPERLLEAMEAAEFGGVPALGVRWWRESIVGLSPQTVEALTAKMNRHPGFYATRKLLSDTRGAKPSQ